MVDGQEQVVLSDASRNSTSEIKIPTVGNFKYAEAPAQMLQRHSGSKLIGDCGKALATGDSPRHSFDRCISIDTSL
jgi:hypothetical protein